MVLVLTIFLTRSFTLTHVIFTSALETYKHTDTHIHTYTHTYRHTHIHTYKQAHIHACMHAYIHTYTHMHTYKRTDTHPYIHKYIHTHIHTYKHTGTQTYIHSNSRSTTWHDSQTNKRGKILEEYIISRIIHIMNEESNQTTFQSRRGSSNIDVAIVNNQLLNALQNWEISAEESCSDHNIIKFDLRQDTYHDTEYSYTGYRYVVTDGSLTKLESNVSRLVATKFRTGQEYPLNLDRALALEVKEANDIDRAVILFQEAFILSCNKSFNKRNATKPMNHKSVPWWTKELTLMRKRTKEPLITTT